MITRGSEWRRWEPHIHAPGTVLNNQFRGPDPWTGYIDALEASSPCIEAIAATDCGFRIDAAHHSEEFPPGIPN